MAKPYKEGAGWAVRQRVCGHDLYLSGFKSEAAARREAERRCAAIVQAGAPAHRGPSRTTLGQAFAQYARERLPSLKSADKDANRLNAYLRACALSLIELEKVDGETVTGPRAYWTVRFVDEFERKIVASLRAHRSALAEKHKNTERVRERLARMYVSDITPVHVAELLEAMAQDGYKQASRINERAELSRLFNYARNVWRWTEPASNPVAAVKLAAADNGRDRVLSNDEWSKVLTHLNEYDNRYVVPAVVLLLETSMRCSDALMTATWRGVDWNRNTLFLPDGKSGARKVPLTPGAVEMLQMLREVEPAPGLDERILKTSYEAVKKAWDVAREAAGIYDVRLHDLRHTSTTRFAMQYHGNLPVLKLITGHKTTVMLMRYINIKAEDVACMMHGREADTRDMPAGYNRSLLQAPAAQTAQNIVQADFTQRRRSA